MPIQKQGRHECLGIVRSMNGLPTLESFFRFGYMDRGLGAGYRRIQDVVGLMAHRLEIDKRLGDLQKFRLDRFSEQIPQRGGHARLFTRLELLADLFHIRMHKRALELGPKLDRLLRAQQVCAGFDQKVEQGVIRRGYSPPYIRFRDRAPSGLQKPRCVLKELVGIRHPSMPALTGKKSEERAKFQILGQELVTR